MAARSAASRRPPAARAVSVPFGAHTNGSFLAWRSADGGYAALYLAPDADDVAHGRPVWLREPRETDYGMDVVVRAVFAVGPALSRDLVVLETFSRPAPAGGAREDAGTVYRYVAGTAQARAELGELLRDVPDAATAMERLAASYRELLPAVPGRLATLFATLPWPQVELTALERLERLAPDHPLHHTYDRTNGFLELRGDGGLPGYQAAAFRHADGGWMVVVQKRYPTTQRTWFMRQAAEDGAWSYVSSAVLPGYAVALDYLLPRRGVQVSLPARDAHAGAQWRWTGRQFEPTPAGAE